MQRFGQVLRVKPEHRDDYVRYHADVWPEVLATIKACNISNYSIFMHDDWLFAYFEYTGDDFQADMRKMAEDPSTQEWWSVMEPMQDPVPTRKQGEWWADMDEVFHVD